MSAIEQVGFCADHVRRHDRERFLTVFLAPPERRESLFALYAFNHEIAKVREVVSEPILGQVRLQWWRESLDGAYAGTPRRHFVVGPLADAIQQSDLSRTYFDRLIDAREERDLGSDQPADITALNAYAKATGGALVLLALEILGARDAAAQAAGRAAGIAYALAGLLRALPFHLQQRRLYLPRDMLDRHGVRPGDVLEGRRPEPLRAVVAEIAAVAAEQAATARHGARTVARSARSPLLHATLAAQHLTRLRRAGYDAYASHLADPPPWRGAALALHGLTGRT